MVSSIPFCVMSFDHPHLLPTPTPSPPPFLPRLPACLAPPQPAWLPLTCLASPQPAAAATGDAVATFDQVRRAAGVQLSCCAEVLPAAEWGSRLFVGFADSLPVTIPAPEVTFKSRDSTDSGIQLPSGI